MKRIETDGLKEQLTTEREGIETFWDLMNFLQNVQEQHMTDYDEKFVSISQAMLATGYYLASLSGTDEYQDYQIMWEIVRDITFYNNICGLQILNFDDMLNPKAGVMFEKTIPSEVFELLQKTAQNLLDNTSEPDPDDVEHWKSIVDGKVPFGYTVKENNKNV